MFSIYTSLYKISSGIFDWEKRLKDFSEFADEVVVSTTAFDDDVSAASLREFAKNNDKVKVIVTDFSLDDYAFDGKLKNAALSECTQKLCILLDMDEVIPLSTKDRWFRFGESLLKNSSSKIHGLLIPSINLCKDEMSYKDIGHKFYLHKNFIGIQRGIVNFAKLDNGKIDIEKSDTTEPILNNGELANFFPLPKDINTIISYELPYVLHYWGVDINKRIKQNEFWSPVWNSRAGKNISQNYSKVSDFDSIITHKHNLPIN